MSDYAEPATAAGCRLTANGRRLFRALFPGGAFAKFVAVAAIDRSALGRLKGHLRPSAAGDANGGMKFERAARSARTALWGVAAGLAVAAAPGVGGFHVLSLLAAGSAAARFAGEAAFGEFALLIGGELELGAAVDAHQRLVLKARRHELILV